MLYLVIVLVVAPIIIPSGTRAVKDLLEKENVEITLRMKISYIVIMTLCCIAYIPAGIYVGQEWSGDLAIFYFVIGFFMLAFPIAYEDDKQKSDGHDPTDTLQHQ